MLKHKLLISVLLLAIGITLSVLAYWIYSIVTEKYGYEIVWVMALLCISSFVSLVFSVRIQVEKRRQDSMQVNQKRKRIEDYVVSQRNDNICQPPDEPVVPRSPVLKNPNKNNESRPPKSRKKPGRKRRFPDEQILQAIRDWDSRDPNDTVTLELFLERRFGISCGVPKAPRSTFYDWRRDFREASEEQEVNEPSTTSACRSRTNSGH